MVGHKHLMLQGCWITSVSSTWMSSSQSCVETSTDSSNSWEPNQKFHTGEVRQLWLEKKIHESSDISENSGGLWLFDPVKVCDCQVSIDVKADLEDLGRDPEEPWWNLEWQISHTNMIQYDCLGTKWWTKHPKKGRLHRKWYNRQLIKQYQTFWYHSKALECVGFNALFDTYENPWNLGWVDSKTLEFIAGQITRWMTPFANLRALKPSNMLCWSWLSLLLLLLWWISCMFESNMFLEEIHSLHCNNMWWLVAAKFIHIGKPCQYIQSVFTPLWYMELQDGFDWIPLDDFALVMAIHCTRTMPCSFGTTTATNCSRTVRVKRRQGGKKSRMAGEAGRQVWEC